MYENFSKLVLQALREFALCKYFRMDLGAIRAVGTDFEWLLLIDSKTVTSTRSYNARKQILDEIQGGCYFAFFRKTAILLAKTAHYNRFGSLVVPSKKLPGSSVPTVNHDFRFDKIRMSYDQVYMTKEVVKIVFICAVFLPSAIWWGWYAV